MNNDQESIDEFLDALWSERGLSKNTLEAYGRDLKLLSKWLAKKSLSLNDVDTGHLQAYIAYCGEKGGKASSMARAFSSLKRYFRYQLREGRIEEDPTALIDAPKLAKPLPSTLSESQVEALLDAAFLCSGSPLGDHCK